MTDAPEVESVQAVAREARADDHRTRLREVAALFLRLGFTAFGGPAAHVAAFPPDVGPIQILCPATGG